MDIDQLMTVQNSVAAGAIWGLSHTLDRIFPWLKTAKGSRLSAVLPIVFGTIAGACGALTVMPPTWSEKIVTGIMVGTVGMLAFKSVSALLPGVKATNTDSSNNDKGA